MKVAFLIWSFFPFAEGGAERQCRLVAHRLAARGVPCTILTAWLDRHLPEAELAAGIPIRRFGRGVETAMRWSNRITSRLARIEPTGRRLPARAARSLSFWGALPWIRRARRSFISDLLRSADSGEIDADIVHAFETSWLAGVADMLAERLAALPLCRCASWPPLGPLPFDVPMRGAWIGRRLRPCYTALTGAMIDDLVSKGIARDRCFLVPNGVVLPEPKAAPRKTGEVLYIGNFSQGAGWKAFDVLIAAWSRVAAAKPEANLSIVGGGDPAPWQEMARSLRCDRSITWHGWTSRPERFFSRAAIFVLPSRVEGMSNALLEAQSHGLPCVVSNIPGNTSVVEHERNGWVVPVEDDRALAESIIALLEDPERRKRLGEAARTRVEETFSLDRVVERLISVYRELLDRGPA